jgi:predicted N-formylglutamate amidohydrolase
MSDDWPDAIEVLNPSGVSDVVLVCEHASNHIPAEYAGLGLTPHDLSRHIAWDIGAAEVTRHLSQLLDAPAYLAAYSRLLIDLNRPLQAQSSVVTCSEDTDIPGNIGLDPDERLRRAERMFLPFHQRITCDLDQRQREGRPTRLVTIHSFTPVYKGVPRPWHAGVLFGEARDFGQAMVAALRQSGLNVDANVPYVSSRDEDYAIPVHGDDRGIAAVLIEIRQDLITHTEASAEWAARLHTALGLMA